MWDCAESEQLWPEPSDPETPHAAFAPCGSRADAVEEREQAGRDLLAAAEGFEGAEDGLRLGDRVVLACDGCVTFSDLEFRELLTASGVAVEPSRSSTFEVVLVEHQAFSSYQSFSAVFMRGLPDGAWQGLYGRSLGHVRAVSFRLGSDALLSLSTVCGSDEVPWQVVCDAVVDLNDRSLLVVDDR